MPIYHRDFIPESTLSQGKLDFMSETEEVGIHQKHPAVIDILSDYARFHVSALPISVHRIRSPEHRKGDSVSSCKVVIDEIKFVSDDGYTEGCGKKLHFIRQS